MGVPRHILLRCKTCRAQVTATLSKELWDKETAESVRSGGNTEDRRFAALYKIDDHKRKRKGGGILKKVLAPEVRCSASGRVLKRKGRYIGGW